MRLVVNAFGVQFCAAFRLTRVPRQLHRALHHKIPLQI